MAQDEFLDKLDSIRISEAITRELLGHCPNLFRDTSACHVVVLSGKLIDDCLERRLFWLRECVVLPANDTSINHVTSQYWVGFAGGDLAHQEGGGPFDA